MKCWLFKSEKLKGKSTNLGHHSTPFLSPSLAFGFLFSISFVVRHAHSLFHSLSIEWNVGGKFQNEIETSWESPKPSNQTPKEKRGTKKKIYDKENERKKMRTKESHRLLFIAFFWLLSSLLRFFFMMIVMIWEWILFVLWIH